MATDRDRTIESLLRREIEAPQSADPCVDAESLAAWMEGGLTSDARAAVEKHAAGCARCQALLASIARTEPDVQQRRWWQNVTAKWLVPVAAAATGLVIWISVGRAPAPSIVPESPSVEASRTAGPPPQPTRVEPPAASPLPGSSNQQSAQVAPNATDRRATQARGEVGRRDRQKENERLAKTEAKQAAEPSLAGTLRDEARAADAAATPPPPPPASARPVPETARARELASTEAKAGAPPTVVESVPVIVDNARAQPFAGRAVVGGIAIAADIQSPEPTYRWRIVPPARVQRSIDGGTTWSVVDPVPASIRGSNGSPGVLTAGSAPARDVCWIVGRAGLVLLSTDGATWQRRTFPETIDLVAVRASNATNAIVTTVDGRQFVSTDGGATWGVVK